VKSVKPRDRKVASTLLMLRVQRGLVKKLNAIIFGPPIGHAPPPVVTPLSRSRHLPGICLGEEATFDLDLEHTLDAR